MNLSVNPVLVFASKKAKMHFGLNKQKGVFVIGAEWLLKLVQNQNLGHTLSPEQCVSIRDELKKYSSVI